MGPYAYKGNQWVSFDDAAMVRHKAQFIRKLGLGGGMIWALDLDDFKDHCGEGVHPLLTSLQSVLAEPSSELDSHPSTDFTTTSNVSPQNSNTEIIEETTHGSIEDHSSNVEISSTLEGNTDFKVVCYCKLYYGITLPKFFLNKKKHSSIFSYQLGMV